MKRSLTSLMILGLLWAGGAQAQTQAKDISVLDELVAKNRQDIEAIQKLIGPQHQLVGSYKIVNGTRKLKLGDELLSGVSASYSFGDINQDGEKDLAVAVENTYGQRALRIYFGEKDKSFKLFREGSKVVLSADLRTESDSFNSVKISEKTGAIAVSHLDDVTMAWNRIQKFKFQNDEIVLISQRRVSTGVSGTVVVDQDFVSGEQIAKSMKSINSPSVVFKSKLPQSKELTKLQDSVVAKD